MATVADGRFLNFLGIKMSWGTGPRFAENHLWQLGKLEGSMEQAASIQLRRQKRPTLRRYDALMVLEKDMIPGTQNVGGYETVMDLILCLAEDELHRSPVNDFLQLPEVTRVHSSLHVLGHPMMDGPSGTDSSSGAIHDPTLPLLVDRKYSIELSRAPFADKSGDLEGAYVLVATAMVELHWCLEIYNELNFIPLARCSYGSCGGWYRRTMLTSHRKRFCCDTCRVLASRHGGKGR